MIPPKSTGPVAAADEEPQARTIRILFGNTHALTAEGRNAGLDAPAVTDVVVPMIEYDEHGNEHQLYTLEPGISVSELAKHLLANADVTRLPNHSALVAVLHAQHGFWNKHSGAKPSWIWSDDDEMQRVLSEFFDCPVGIPDDVEMTHHTKNGPPGTGPGCEPDDEEA